MRLGVSTWRDSVSRHEMRDPQDSLWLSAFNLVTKSALARKVAWATAGLVWLPLMKKDANEQTASASRAAEEASRLAHATRFA